MLGPSCSCPKVSPPRPRGPRSRAPQPRGRVLGSGVLAWVMVVLGLLIAPGPAWAGPETAPGSTSVASDSEKGKPPTPASATASEDASPPPPVEIQGQLELQLDDGHLNTRSQTDSFPALDGIAGEPAATHLSIRRLRLSVTSHLGRDADLVVQGHMDSRADESELRDCYLRLRLPRDLTLLAGQFKVRFGREGLDSSTRTMTVERSDMSRALYQERDLGLNLSGGSEKGCRWDVGVFQGQGRNARDRNDHKDASLRLVFPLGEDLQVGVSGQLGSMRPEDGTVDLPVRRFGADALYRKGAWTWQTEAIFGQGWNSFSRRDSRAFGAYLGSAFQVSPACDLVAFYDWFDPDLDRQDPALASNRVNARNRMVLGVNWYLDRQAPHRFMLNYELHRPTEGPRLEPDGWRLRYQLRF